MTAINVANEDVEQHERLNIAIEMLHQLYQLETLTQKLASWGSQYQGYPVVGEGNF